MHAGKKDKFCCLNGSSLTDEKKKLGKKIFFLLSTWEN
jgi:hypothetical protein